MYSVRPYLEKADITPAKIMYHVASYHQPHKDFSGECSNSETTSDFIANVRYVQQEIITRLTSLHKSLKELNLNGPSTENSSVTLKNFTLNHLVILKLLVAYSKTKGIRLQIVENKEITVNYSGPTLVGDISSPENTLKLIGETLEIYTTKSSSDQEKWIEAVAKSQRIETNTMRELSRALSANDFICAYNSISLADLIVRAVFVDNDGQKLSNWKNINAPNNVQLWIKRIDECLSI